MLVGNAAAVTGAATVAPGTNADGGAGARMTDGSGVEADANGVGVANSVVGANGRTGETAAGGEDVAVANGMVAIDGEAAAATGLGAAARMTVDRATVDDGCGAIVAPKRERRTDDVSSAATAVVTRAGALVRIAWRALAWAASGSISGAPMRALRWMNVPASGNGGTGATAGCPGSVTSVAGCHVRATAGCGV
jgi:hypothetical protein